MNEIKGESKVSSPALTELRDRTMSLIEELEFVEIDVVPREKNSMADRLANLAMDRGIAKTAPAVSATDVGGVAPVMPELNGVVRDGVIHFTGGTLPDGAQVKIRLVRK